MNSMSNRKTWERMESEPENWFLRFTRYLNAGLNRSFLGVYNDERAERGKGKALRISGAWERRVKQFDWAERARLYDLELVRSEREEWDKRRKEHREKEMKLARKLIERAEQMLQFPLARTENVSQVDNGVVINQTIVNPSNWKFSDIPRVIETADKLARLAMEMETNREAIDASIGSPAEIEDIRRKRWEQISSILVDLEDEDKENGESDTE